MSSLQEEGILLTSYGPVEEKKLEVESDIDDKQAPLTPINSPDVTQDNYHPNHNHKVCFCYFNLIALQLVKHNYNIMWYIYLMYIYVYILFYRKLLC